MVDALWRAGLRVAFVVFRAWTILLRPRLRSVHMLIRVGPRLLVVRHSYKRGLSAPAGMVHRGEPAATGAARELREEVGIDLPPDRLRAVLELETQCESARDTVHVFEARFDAEPEVTIDRREIVWAAFLTEDEILAQRLRPTFAAVLDAVAADHR